MEYSKAYGSSNHSQCFSSIKTKTAPSRQTTTLKSVLPTSMPLKSPSTKRIVSTTSKLDMKSVPLTPLPKSTAQSIHISGVLHKKQVKPNNTETQVPVSCLLPQKSSVMRERNPKLGIERKIPSAKQNVNQKVQDSGYQYGQGEANLFLQNKFSNGDVFQSRKILSTWLSK